MTEHTDWVRALLRPPEDESSTDGTADFDGGARTSLPEPPPGMNTLLRRARFGPVAGLDDAPGRGV